MKSTATLPQPRRYLVPRRYYANLYKTVFAMNSSLHVSDVMTAVADKMVEVLEAKACALLLLSPDRQKTWLGQACGFSDSFLQKKPTLASSAILDSLSAVNRPLSVLKASEDPRVGPQSEVRKEGIASILYVPLLLKEKMIAVLAVFTGEPRQFPDEEVAFAEGVADLAAQAMGNAQLFESAVPGGRPESENLLAWRNSWAVK